VGGVALAVELNPEIALTREPRPAIALPTLA
jgi:hypothetical protein